MSDASRDADADAPPLREVSSRLRDAGMGEVEIHDTAGECVDVTVCPVRAPETPTDVELRFSVGHTTVYLALDEDDAQALEDLIHQALDVEPLEG